jgi:Arginyl-tRNA synthetase
VIEDELQAWFRSGLEAAASELGLDGELPEPEVMEPRQKEHGDFATNVALAVASGIAASPRTVAEAIVAALPPAAFVRKVEVAGPGFINVFVTEGWLHDVLRRIAAEGTSYGVAPRTQQRVQVEFVSANPTGPCTSGTRGTPCSATRSPVYSMPPGGSWSVSTTTTTPGVRWTGSAPRWTRAT